MNFGSLPVGEHEFEFHVSDAFFQQFENSILEKGEADILVVLNKKEGLMLLDFTIQGMLHLPCDRCLQDIPFEVENYFELILKAGILSGDEETSETIISISPKEHEIDLAPYIYEFLTVSVPLRKIHEDADGNPTCDPEVLKELEKYAPHEEQGEENHDPRWEMLKKIHLN